MKSLQRFLHPLPLLLAALAFLSLLPPPAVSAQDSASATRFVTAPDGVRIAYEVHGSGSPALVFIHGWSCDRSYWAGQLPAFAKSFQVVAIDVGGHGESGLGRKEWTMESFGLDVAAVVKRLDLHRVILIGHSMGGDVIAEAARHLKGRVLGLVWLDTYKKLGAGRSPEVVDTLVAHLRADFVDSTRVLVRSFFVPTSDTVLRERVAADMSSAPPAVALSAVYYAMSYSRQVVATLHELKLPVIAINPDNAPTDTASMQRNGVEVMIMPGVGHFVMMEDPERLNGLLRTAIDRLSR